MIQVTTNTNEIINIDKIEKMIVTKNKDNTFGMVVEGVMLNNKPVGISMDNLNLSGEMWKILDEMKIGQSAALTSVE